MPEFAYENFSVEEAIKLLSGGDAGSGPEDRTWSGDRRRRAPTWLRAATAKWLLDLPEAVRPLQLAKRYPRVANDLCLLWRRPALYERYMANLLIVRRGGRRRHGFPPQLASELAVLIAHHAALYPSAPASGGADASR